MTQRVKIYVTRSGERQRWLTTYGPNGRIVNTRQLREDEPIPPGVPVDG